MPSQGAQVEVDVAAVEKVHGLLGDGAAGLAQEFPLVDEAGDAMVLGDEHVWAKPLGFGEAHQGGLLEARRQRQSRRGGGCGRRQGDQEDQTQPEPAAEPTTPRCAR
jgi:hypothetical protein